MEDSKSFEKNKEVGKSQYPQVEEYCKPYRSYEAYRKGEYLVHYYNCCKDALGISHCENGRNVDWPKSFASIGLLLGGTILWALREPIYDDLARLTSSCRRRVTAIKNFCTAPLRLSWGRADGSASSSEVQRAARIASEARDREQRRGYNDEMRQMPFGNGGRRYGGGMRQRPYGNRQWDEISMTAPHQMYSDTISQSLRMEKADVPACSRAKAPSQFHDYSWAPSSQMGENMLPSNVPDAGLNPMASSRQLEANSSVNFRAEASWRKLIGGAFPKYCEET